MKIKKLLILVSSLFLLQGCYEDEQPTDFNYQVGDEIVKVPMFSSETDSVVYYWDDVKIATKYQVPYVYKYKVQDADASSSHSYTITTYYRPSVTTSVNGSSTISFRTHQKNYTIKIK